MKKIGTDKHPRSRVISRPFFLPKSTYPLPHRNPFFGDTHLKPASLQAKTISLDEIPTLRYGSRGIRVQQLQERLNAHGATLATDGIFGPQTYQAVRRFQKAYALQVDGIAGPVTWKTLRDIPLIRNAGQTEQGNTAESVEQPATSGLTPLIKNHLASGLETPASALGTSSKDIGLSSGFSKKHQSREQQKAISAIAQSYYVLNEDTYPKASSLHYKWKGAPKSHAEAFLRLERKKAPGYALSAAEENWLYAYLRVLGVLHASNAYKHYSDQSEYLNPVRNKIVLLALGQIGLVEAYTDSGEKRDVGGETISVRKGGDRLLHYIEMTSPNSAKTPEQKRAILNFRTHVGPKIVNGKVVPGGNQTPSWCGILALWIQNTAGNGGGTWPPNWEGPKRGDGKHEFMPRTEIPKPGDIAYKSAEDHHATVIRVDGKKIITVDGNTGMHSSIYLRSKARSDWDGFIRAVPRGKG